MAQKGKRNADHRLLLTLACGCLKGFATVGR
jgi:hypothetical protein